MIDVSTDSYFSKKEELLGLTQPRQTNGNGAAQPAPAPRQSAPAPQQARPASPVSAPPHRDAPSMTTGRSASEPLRLTAEELSLAATMGISPQQYAEGKKRMLREKAAGLHDGR
jgi:hypothetical protein